MKKLLADVPRWTEVVTKTYPKGTVVGIDGRLVSASTGEIYKKTLQENGMTLEIMNYNIIDQFWTTRCKSSACDIFVHESWAGIPAA